jgi:hypothetical protein
MIWSEPVSLYCERASPAFWAEPVNALSNIAFLIAAAAAWYLRTRIGARDWESGALIAVIGIIGVGSFAFHTLATRGAVLFDVIPIAVFVYGYLLLALRRFLRLAAAPAFAVLIGFFAASFAVSDVVPTGFLNGSSEYLMPLAALVVVGVLAPIDSVRRSITPAAILFAVSLVFRTIDRAVCTHFALGTHFIWHILNAAVLFILLRTAVVFKNHFDGETGARL